MSLPPHRLRYYILLVVAAGEVVARRVRPACHHLQQELGLEQIVYLDLHERPPFEPRPGESYVQIQPGNQLPLDELRRRHLLGPHTLALICTPTGWHLHYASQLRPFAGRTAIEKPLTREVVAARRLVRREHGRPYPIDHFLFKETMLQFCRRCRLGDAPDFRSCTGIRVDLLESRGVGQRLIDPTLWDLGVHAFACLLAPLRAVGCGDTRVEVREVRTATYEPPAGEPAPSVSTAARLTGQLRIAGTWLPFDIRLGKGLGIDRKEVAFLGRPGQESTIDLSESGWQAHYRALRELLTADRPNMGLKLSDAVAIVQYCSSAEQIARMADPYPFGEMPAFLRGECQTPALMGLYV